ncbi:hypothetical protein MSAN_01989700 [Mycena sanguinolenta]|uniref:Uncharacterized protein n=1 Tax=Mycena sanguinolenta TaxID=230812 RepID=A0A8H7CM38_9AGAR|nr:hypothetical protein MSAN_01989700 [Mycena sanguinolenta]
MASASIRLRESRPELRKEGTSQIGDVHVPLTLFDNDDADICGLGLRLDDATYSMREALRLQQVWILLPESKDAQKSRELGTSSWLAGILSSAITRLDLCTCNLRLAAPLTRGSPHRRPLYPPRRRTNAPHTRLDIMIDSAHAPSPPSSCRCAATARRPPATARLSFVVVIDARCRCHVSDCDSPSVR